jgi:Fe-S cluster assembly iron-binding protein IscA
MKIYEIIYWSVHKIFWFKYSLLNYTLNTTCFSFATGKNTRDRSPEINVAKVTIHLFQFSVLENAHLDFQEEIALS